MNNMFELLNIQTLSQVHRLCGGSHSFALVAVHRGRYTSLFLQLEPMTVRGRVKAEKERCEHCCTSCAGIAVCSPAPLTLILSADPRVMVLPHFA